MNLYLIYRTDTVGYDEYDSAVVCAESEEDARMIHPGGYDDWDGRRGPYGSWTDADKVSVEFVGMPASPRRGVICASFNAG